MFGVPNKSVNRGRQFRGWRSTAGTYSRRFSSRIYWYRDKERLLLRLQPLLLISHYCCLLNPQDGRHEIRSTDYGVTRRCVFCSLLLHVDYTADYGICLGRICRTFNHEDSIRLRRTRSHRNGELIARTGWFLERLILTCVIRKTAVSSTTGAESLENVTLGNLDETLCESTIADATHLAYLPAPACLGKILV